MTSDNIFNTLSPGKQAQIIADLMELFKSNDRGYGLGDFQGARFDEDKSKWIPGHVRWSWGATGEQEWRDHLAGERLLGQGVLHDDGKVWYACLDIDIYEIDYADEMHKISRSKLPLVVFRTKSGGLRITVFFSEAIEAETVIPRMKRISSQLGYAGCEVFPKQTRLDVTNGDCPSWIFVPFGGTNDMFPEQGCMTDNGNLMELHDAVEHMKGQRITRIQFMTLFAAEEVARTNGKTNGKKHPKGAWVEETSEDVTINTMFCDGPPCLWTIAHEGSRDMQNNFLTNAATFLIRKYPENWDKALEWVNYHILKPVGDRDKLTDMIKRFKDRRDTYDYMCKQEPIVSRCFSYACRKMTYGVGAGVGGIDFYDMGMTIINRIPRMFFVNSGSGESRMLLEHTEVTNQNKFRDKCVSYGYPLRPRVKPDEWDRIVNKNIEEATIVEPSAVMRTNAVELEFLSNWLGHLIPNYIRMGDKTDDAARAVEEEKRIYFKHKKLMKYCISQNFDDGAMRRYIDSNCKYHREETGLRVWYRWTYSAPFEMFDEEDIEKWLSVERPE